MGVSLGATLCFGYNLGGGESSGCWNIAEEIPEPYGAPDAPWWKPENTTGEKIWVDDDDTPDSLQAYADAANELLKDTGVEATFDYQYRGEFTSDLILSVWASESLEGETISADMIELERRRVEEKWDAKLANAAKMLGVTPTQKPMWHVLPSYF